MENIVNATKPASLEKKGQPKIFYFSHNHQDREYYTGTIDANFEFTKSMKAFAEKIKEEGSQADYVILIDPIASDIVASSQSFFDEELEAALKNVGVEMKVRGCFGGRIDLTEYIQNKFPDFKPDNEYRNPNDGLFYEVLKD